MPWKSKYLYLNPPQVYKTGWNKAGQKSINIPNSYAGIGDIPVLSGDSSTESLIGDSYGKAQAFTMYLP